MELIQMNQRHHNYGLTRVLPAMLLVALLIPAISLQGQDPVEFQLSVSGSDVDYSSGDPAAFGFTSVVSAIQTLGDAALTQGYQIGIGNDPDLLQITSTTTLLTGPDGAAPDFDDVNFYANGVTQGIVYSFGGDWMLIFDVDTPLLEIEIQLVDGPLTGASTATVTDVAFVDDLGIPLIPNLVVVGGASIFPSMVDVSVILTPYEGALLIRGDASGDGVLDLSDGVGILDYLFNGTPSTCLDALDADDSGNISITDAVVVLCSMFCMGSPPPANPFPGCGFDTTTGDPLDCLAFPGCA
jgi:hypothetical protein